MREVDRKKPTLVTLSPKATRDFMLFAAVRDLPRMARVIYQMALDNDAKFFKQLGKALSGRKYTGLGFNKREAFIFEYFATEPNGTNAGCMAKMAKAKFPRISEENFRMLKKRLFAKIGFTDPNDFVEEGEWFKTHFRL